MSGLNFDHACLRMPAGLYTGSNLTESHIVAICRRKDKSSLQRSNGFRISGMSTCHEGLRRKFDKKASVAESSRDLTAFLQSFVCHTSSQRQSQARGATLIDQIVEKLADIERWACDASVGPQWRFLSVSLLVVHESTGDQDSVAGGQQAANTHACVPRRVRVALIDFAHCFFGETGVDSNFVRGLRALSSSLARARTGLLRESGQELPSH